MAKGGWHSHQNQSSTLLSVTSEEPGPLDYVERMTLESPTVQRSLGQNLIQEELRCRYQS